jgi:hypothetical protein
MGTGMTTLTELGGYTSRHGDNLKGPALYLRARPMDSRTATSNSGWYYFIL